MGSVDTSLSDLVTIIVKAPNQQIADQTIKCHLNWSIKKLKDYLSQVYPSKPKLEEQKLIYSGKLLTDTAILKDILRTYEGQENHTVHLVCATKASSLNSEKKSLPRSNSTESDSNYDDTHDNEHDNVNGSQSASQRNVPNTPFTFSAGGVSFFGQMNGNQIPSMGGFDSRFSWPGVSGLNGVNDVNVNHHFMMMQQAYAQYLTQYMQMMGQSSPGFMTSPFTNPVSRTSQSAGTTNHLNFNNFNNLPRVRPPQVIEEENANPPVAAVAGNDVEDEENRNNRDWLDYFYGISRIAVLFVVVYFYSTPLRLLGVLVILSMFYFQQNMRLQNDQLNANLNNNNINIANNNNQNNANNGENNDRGERPEDAANAAESNRETTEPTDDTSTRRAEPPPVPERLSLIGVTVLAIRTFFLSLVPDTPAM